MPIFPSPASLKFNSISASDAIYTAKPVEKCTWAAFLSAEPAAILSP